jgi:arylsulfatase A-like enzyme
MSMVRSRTGLAVSGLLLLTLTILFWWLNPSAPGNRDVPVIIYLVDTLRADRLGFYGYPGPTSPNLDRLAGGSVVFQQAYAPAPWTLPSVAALMTSTFACEHGLEARKKLSPQLRTLAERFKTAGYFTASVYHNLWVGPLAGLDRGYDSASFRLLERDAWRSDIDELLQRTDRGPFFLYLHSMEPHDPHQTPYQYISRFGHVSLEQRKRYKNLITHYNALRQADWMAQRPPGTTDNADRQERTAKALERMRDSIEHLYDASVLWADTNLGQVISDLQERDIWNEAIFIFLSDHGEELSDHGNWLHGHSVYEELVRVPLLIHFPNGEFAGRQIGTPVSLVDIMPTIFDYLGRPELCADCRGSSVMPMLRSTSADPVRPAEPVIPALRMNQISYYRPRKEVRGDVNVVLRQDYWKGIWNDELQDLELYDLSQDSGEQQDLSSDNPELSELFGETARRWLHDCRARESAEAWEMDDKTREQLESLGYFN